MNLNQKINGIFCLSLVTMFFLLVLTVILFFYQNNDLKMMMNDMAVNNAINLPETEVAYDDSLKKNCLKNGYTLFNKEIPRSVVLELMSGQLYKEYYCIGSGFISKNSILRWENYLIYTYLDFNEDCTDGKCDEDDVIRKIYAFDLESGNKNLLWSGVFNGKNEKGEDQIFNSISVKHFYVIDDYLYLTLGTDCSEGCSGYWNMGVTFRLSLNDPQEMEYLNLEGQLIVYNGDYYEYKYSSDIGGGGITYFEKYDLLKKDKISDYKIGEKMDSLLVAEKLVNEYFENYDYIYVDMKGFAGNRVIFNISVSDYMTDETDHLMVSLDLDNGEVKELSVAPKMDLDLLISGDTERGHAKKSEHVISGTKFDLLLEGFEDKYGFISYQ